MTEKQLKDNSGLIYQTIKRASILAQKVELLTKRVEELEKRFEETDKAKEYQAYKIS